MLSNAVVSMMDLHWEGNHRPVLEQDMRLNEITFYEGTDEVEIRGLKGTTGLAFSPASKISGDVTASLDSGFIRSAEIEFPSNSRDGLLDALAAPGNTARILLR